MYSSLSFIANWTFPLACYPVNFSTCLLISFSVITFNLIVHIYMLLSGMIQMEPLPQAFFFPLTQFLPSAYRKNLSELDEVQRYFSQKLTKSFPDFSYGNTSRPSHEEQESDHRGSMSREVDPNGCHLLERSSQLVSQVSSLISGKLSPGLELVVRSCLKGSANILCVQDQLLVLVICACWSRGREVCRDFQTPLTNDNVELKHWVRRFSGN